jgi:cell division protein FtsL
MPENIPYTTDYLILALIVVFGILALFLVSLTLRYRSLQKDLHLIEQLKDEQ